MSKSIMSISAITTAIAWLVTFGIAGYSTSLPAYIQEAAWWHKGLFGVWFALQLWANILWVAWFYERPLRQRRKDLATQPPQHAG